MNRSIGLYTPINYFGWYATCSHNKDGGRSHIQSRETIGQENHVTCLKLRPRVNFVLRLEPLPRHVFSINTSSSNTLSLFTQFLRSGNTLPPVWLNRRQIATTWMGLADIQNIHWLWDFFQSQRNRLFPTIKRKTF